MKIIKTTKELRQLIRDTSLNELESLIYKIKTSSYSKKVYKERQDLLVSSRNRPDMMIDNFYIEDNGKIVVQECPAWSARFKNKTLFSYNVKLEEEIK